MSQLKKDDNQVPVMELPSTPEDLTPSVQDNLAENSDNKLSTEQGHAQALEQALSQSAPAASPAASTQADDPTQLDITTTLPVDPALVVPVTPTNMPAIADDNDLIEKEWVEKAKHIVNQTKDDPHLQNREMSKVKVDYLKKRYNKEVKLVEE